MQTIDDPNHVLTFTKYKGQSLKMVMDEDPNFLLWLQRNVPEFDLDHKLLDEIEEKAATWRP